MRRGIIQHGLATAACLALLAAPAAAQYTQSSSACAPFSPIAGTPGSTLLGTVSSCDDCTEGVALPFTFMLYGDTPVTAVRVSSNGQINLDPGDFSNNCCSEDAVQVGFPYTQPRIAIAQEDLRPSGGGNVYTRNTGSSFIVSFENVPFYFSTGNCNAQAELFPNGNVQIRWGGCVGGSFDDIAAGLEDDTHAPPWASPVTGGPFGPTGIANVGSPVTGCRLFSVAAPVESDCANGIDDDGDGATDCADTDCIGDPACSSGGGDCDLTPVIALLNALQDSVDALEVKLVSIEAKADSLEAKADASESRLDALAATMDSIGATQCNVIQLLTTPQGRRIMECGGETYSWNDTASAGD